jgi:hypothetical protein
LKPLNAVNKENQFKKKYVLKPLNAVNKENQFKKE